MCLLWTQITKDTPGKLHLFIYLFIHSFYFYSASSGPLLLRSALDTARILCRSFTPKHHWQLRVKDLPKVPTWPLERDSNSRHFGRKASNLPMRHHAPQIGVSKYPLRGSQTRCIICTWAHRCVHAFGHYGQLHNQLLNKAPIISLNSVTLYLITDCHS